MGRARWPMTVRPIITLVLALGVGALLAMAVLGGFHSSREAGWPLGRRFGLSGQVTSRKAHEARSISPSLIRSTGFYVHPREGNFNRLATKAGTDKVTLHQYDTLYSRYMELPPGRQKVRKMLEIGLGCYMEYGPGVSARLWREYFPDAEVYMAEYDVPCVEANMDKMDALGIKVVTGDQSNIQHLKSWITRTGGNLDLIVDDGGHKNIQQYNSFMMLFTHALKPGGLYVIEDLQVSRSTFSDNQLSELVMIEVIKDWIEALLDFDAFPDAPNHAYKIKHGMPPGIRSIECTAEACAFIKCYEDDVRCKQYPEVMMLQDMSAWSYP